MQTTSSAQAADVADPWPGSLSASGLTTVRCRPAEASAPVEASGDSSCAAACLSVARALSADHFAFTAGSTFSFHPRFISGPLTMTACTPIPTAKIAAAARSSSGESPSSLGSLNSAGPRLLLDSRSNRSARSAPGVSCDVAKNAPPGIRTSRGTHSSFWFTWLLLLNAPCRILHTLGLSLIPKGFGDSVLRKGPCVRSADAFGGAPGGPGWRK